VGATPDAEASEQLTKALDTFDGYLQGKTYLVGSSPTLADFACLSTVTFLELMDYDFSKWSNVTKWIAKCKELPYFEEANKGLYEMKEALKQQ